MRSLQFVSSISFALMLAACSVQDQNKIRNENLSPIIGGSVYDSTDFVAKSTVALRVIEISKQTGIVKYGAGCTGSLIRKDIVLTAAHCVPKKDQVSETSIFAMAVIFGTDIKAAQQIQYTDKFLAHPEYGVAEAEYKEVPSDEPANLYDVALIKVLMPPPEGFKPAPILVNEDLLVKGIQVTVAGYGITDDLNQTPTTVAKKASLYVAEHYGKEVILEQSKGEGVCSGDSGGPAFLEVKGVQYLWGVASRVASSDRKKYCSQLSVFSKIYSYKSFMKTGMAELDK